MVDPRFPALKARALHRVLVRDLGYVRVRKGRGSHQRLKAPGRPPITWAFHDRQTISPGVVHDVLCKQVGLDIDDALRLL